MRPGLKYGLFFLLFSIGCGKESNSPELEEKDLNHITDGFCIQFGNSIIINHEEIDYYDFSTHMIYLKEPHEFLQDKYNWEAAFMSFSVYANKEKVYTGCLYPAWSSSPVFTETFIDFPFRYPRYVIKINNWYYYQGNSKPDPREDEKIVNALKAYDQFHAGLSCSIDEIDIKPIGQQSFKFTIANKDTFNYYILCPDKMGFELFHYFTNGLLLFNETTSWLQHQCSTISPEPWDSWSIDWLDIIVSGESKSYNIHYSDFDTIPSGQYQVSFYYPGLFNVEINDINQSDGRIWLGGITAKIEGFVE